MKKIINKIITDNEAEVREKKVGWAEKISVDGLPNFHKVSHNLYRGAQPESKKGIEYLNNIGVRTVVNLRSFHSDRKLITGTDIDYEHFLMRTWHPTRRHVRKFLKIITDPAKNPVFVHCQHGADRTGLMCAIYRIVICGWTKEEAIEEMCYGGFGYHVIWKNIIKFIEKLDIDKIKKRNK
jgi:protein tyrosine/serine phosphatase